MQQKEIRELIRKMTLEEKASLCSGADVWHTKAVERLGIPAIMVSDGPHGLRKQEMTADHLGINESISAVCFPAGCASACSWDREVMRSIGTALGNECRAEGVSVILGPAINIKRSPLCGRNFEYLSEDPCLAGELASAYIDGVQSRNVGTSLKHFFANNQEYRRMTSSSDMDERTMREIYLAPFETAVKQSKPWTVMNSYNRVNGAYVGETKEYLTDILRNEWGFDGFVMTDWGAVNERVPALKAGCDLEMPSSGGLNDKLIVDAVREGKLDEKLVDQACERILNIVFRYTENKKQAAFDREADHETARRAEADSIVLLKNEDSILPVKAGTKLAVIGKYALAPRYQGGGSSHINSCRVDAALDALKAYTSVTYAEGFHDDKDETDEKLLSEAARIAAHADLAVIFAGLPDAFESEGFDRKHLHMPESQNELIREVCKAQPNTVVVLHNGAPVEMPWINEVKGLVETYLGGQAVGPAVADVLTGKVNPSGHLAETFPLRLEDTPCYLTYGGDHDHSSYGEGVFVGYRYYVSRNMRVLFPFGYGLSYTDFRYKNLHFDKHTMADSDIAQVYVDVENAGEVRGKALVQLYVAPPQNGLKRPLRELKRFERVELMPGEIRTVSFTLDKRCFAAWDTRMHDWYTEEGDYSVQICSDAQTVQLEESIHVTPAKAYRPEFTLNSTLGEILATEKGKAMLGAMMGGAASDEYSSDIMSPEALAAFINDMPLRQMKSFMPGNAAEMVDGILYQLNH